MNDELWTASTDGPVVDGWSRRRFLQLVGAGAVGSAVFTVPGWLPEAAADRAMTAAPLTANEGVLVLISLWGGNDGLNTIVPYTNGRYYDLRRNIAIEPERVLRLDHTYGLHPSLVTLKSLWDQGRVAAVNGVGYSPPDLSHFNSIATWMVGKYGRTGGPTGWLGRWADGLPADVGDFALASMGAAVPLQLRGARPGFDPIAIPVEPVMFDPVDPIRSALAGMVATAATGRGSWGDAIATAMAATMDTAARIMPVHRPGELLRSDLPGKLVMAANLINANLGLRVIEIGTGGWDTHSDQVPVQDNHLAEVDRGLAEFFARLDVARRPQVTIMIESEFGRTPLANFSNGTDHGTANTLFLIGDNVAAGHHGDMPRFTSMDREGRLESPVDFRAVFGNVLEHWLGSTGLGAAPGEVVGGSYPDLGLFRAPPGSAAGPHPPGQAVLPPAGFVSLSPVRVLDSRDGTGGRFTPIVADEELRFRLGGRSGVPGEAQAVLLNLTATEPSERTFVTAWDAGSPRPVASSINPTPGLSSPGLVVGRLGERGEVTFAIGHGQLDLIADVVGYFDSTSMAGFQALVPRRLMDTRIPQLPFGAEEARALQVAGTDDVPPDATALALNLTVTLASRATHLTLWPDGEQMPLASSINVIPGQTVANMVVARVGVGGAIRIFNQFGDVHVIVDQLGYFRPGQTDGRYVTMTPSRVLDTRIGLGAPLARVGTAPLRLVLRGVGGVPATATAVMMNVTADQSSQPTHLTVYPSGATMPVASNLNVVPGMSVPNMVAVPIGADGTITMVNAFGTVDLIADVVGYFTS